MLTQTRLVLITQHLFDAIITQSATLAQLEVASRLSRSFLRLPSPLLTSLASPHPSPLVPGAS